LRPARQSTIELGHSLGLAVVAEGVEDRRALAPLRELGCDLAQGFALGRPLPARDLRWSGLHLAFDADAPRAA
jgi:EAL domain-containing protein (putative c-di-GMP-specific phosphodiesterase class I)